MEQANLFGNAVIAIRGHVDPTKTLSQFVKAGLQKGIIKRSGSPGHREYFYKGRPLDINDTAAIVELVESGALDGTEANPRLYMQAALTLSRKRAEAVRDSIIEYAKEKGLSLDKSQIQPVGIGIGEPLIPRPRTLAETAKNMRVEFRLMKVPAEVINEGDLDF